MSTTPRRWTGRPAFAASETSRGRSNSVQQREAQRSWSHRTSSSRPYPAWANTLSRRSRKLSLSMDNISSAHSYSTMADYDHYLPGSQADDRHAGRPAYSSYPSETRYPMNRYDYDVTGDPSLYQYGETNASSYPQATQSYGMLAQNAHSLYAGNDRHSPISPSDPLHSPPDLFQGGYAHYADSRIPRPINTSSYLDDVSRDYSMGAPMSYPNSAYPSSRHTAPGFNGVNGHHLGSSMAPPYPFDNAAPYPDSVQRSPAHIDAVQIQMARLRSHQSEPMNDLETFIRPYIHEYLNTSNRLALGERSVIIISSKVAQKSYGAEKRFLCPPPTAILVGNSWWTESSKRGQPSTLRPPKVIVSMSGETPPPESGLEWTDASGKVIDAEHPPMNTTYVGRSVGKQLFISDAEEKKKTVEALVQVFAAASDNEPEREIGTFSSSSIKVISKPAKRRQSAKLAKNLELYINHGSTVSLFHRLRSQTVSTKYLCVSASSASFKGSDGKPLQGFDPNGTQNHTFIARTASWDPFVIYIVDTNKPNTGSSAGPSVPPAPLHPYFPSPPPNAINIGSGAQTPVYYNQTVVLQCLTSGVVSPVLIIRKLEFATTVVGGGPQDGAQTSVSNAYCPTGEVWGDPVSQLHKIAFEVYDETKHGLSPHAGTVGDSGQFLACVGEKVNTCRPTEERKWIPGASVNGFPASPMMSLSPSSEYPPSSPTTGFASNDGGKVPVHKRTRSRSSAGNGPKNAIPKSRRRPGSADSGTSAKNVPPPEGVASSGALWQVDIGETSVWTIVGTDQVRYDFYVPPVLFDQQTRLPSDLSFPAPSSPVTPFPAVVKYLPPDRASEAPKGHTRSMAKPSPDDANMVTLYGQNFSSQKPYEVYYGDDRSPAVEVRCSEVVGALPPPEAPTPRPILLVRSDGVIFPSNVMYP